MAGRDTPPPPDHEDKPVVHDDKASVGERLTGVSDPKDPDGLLTLDDVNAAEGARGRPVPADDSSTGPSVAGAAPGGSMPERVVGGDAPDLGSLDAGGDSMGDDADLPTATQPGTETP